MRVSETFYRPDTPLDREDHTLPAPLYHLLRRLLQHSGESCVFIPIRTLQYLAVMDVAEVIFVDSHNRPYIELAWQRFRPQTRSGLDEPVAYEVVYYLDKGRQTMHRLSQEFHLALQALDARQVQDEEAVVLPLPTSRR